MTKKPTQKDSANLQKNCKPPQKNSKTQQTTINNAKPARRLTQKTARKAKKETAKQPFVNTPKKRSAYGVLLAICLLAVLFAVLVWQTFFTVVIDKPHVLKVDQGQSYYQLSEQWQQDNPLFSLGLVKAYIRFAIHKPLHAGEYQLPQHATLWQVLHILQQGKQSALLKLTVVEGKTVADLLAQLQHTQNVLIEVADKPETDIITELNLPIEHLEGWFAPDTYYFSQGSSDKQILRHLYEQQKNILDSAWQNKAANLPYKTAYEALIMASIIEKETGVASERHKVAGLFINRLNQGMRLQTDPTVIYGIRHRYDGNITKTDLQEKTPYNTYQIDGLPPTPIALPSKAAIDAALNPEKTPYLYFVATGKGGHYFSETYAEHQKNVQQYLQITQHN